MGGCKRCEEAMIDKSMYWTPNRILSYNRVLNYVIGGRGIGKTTGMKIYTTNRFLKHNEQFMYLKRYKTDIKNLAPKFFNTVKGEFEGVQFSNKGNQLKINDKNAGLILPLSAWQSVKADEFKDVTTIIYDEFLLEDSSNQIYLDDEARALLNLMDTVIRNRDDVRVICLANAVSITNPHFTYFKITPDSSKEFNKYDNIVVEIPDSKDFASARRKTKFGQLIDGTEYGEFSLDNKFTADIPVFIEKRSKNSKFQFSVIYQGMTIGVWVDKERHLMYMSNDHDPKTNYRFALTPNDHNIGNTLLTTHRDNYFLKKLVSAYKQGLLRFDNQVLRNVGYDIFRKMNIR